MCYYITTIIKKEYIIRFTLDVQERGVVPNGKSALIAS